MTDFRMNKNKPIGSKTLSTIAGYTPVRRPQPASESKPTFEVTPDLTEEEVAAAPVAEVLGGMIASLDEGACCGACSEEERASGDDEAETIDSEIEAKEAQMRVEMEAEPDQVGPTEQENGDDTDEPECTEGAECDSVSAVETETADIEDEDDEPKTTEEPK